MASGKNLNCMEMAQTLWQMFLLPFCQWLGSSSSFQECLKFGHRIALASVAQSFFSANLLLNNLSTNPDAAAVEAEGQIGRSV